MTRPDQVRTSFPAWRVFIYGVEVTDDVTTCTINWNDKRSPNTAQFTVSSELDRYIVTAHDIHGLYDDIKFDESIDLSMFDSDDKEHIKLLEELVQSNVSSRVDTFILDPLKKKVLLNKYSIRQRTKTQSDITNAYEDSVAGATKSARLAARNNTTSVVKFASLTGDYLRFPLQVGHPIFHTGDPVRIFWRDPFNANDWYFAMTGFVSDWAEDTDEKGLRQVTFTVEDTLRSFRLSRITTNAAIADIDQVMDPDQDTVTRTFHEDHFVNLTMPELLFLLTFGENYIGEAGKTALNQNKTGGPVNAPKALDQRRYGIHGSTPHLPPASGCGAFNRDESQVCVLGPNSNDPQAVVEGIGDTPFVHLSGDTALEDWQSRIDHKVVNTLSVLEQMCILDARSDESLHWTALASESEGYGGEIPIHEVITRVGERPELYPVDFGRVMMLIPSELGPGTNRDTMLRDIIKSVATQTKFAPRLQLMYDVAERVQFSFYATPKGDVICEMPLYTFRPENFGEYAPRYQFPVDDTIKFSSNFSHEHVKTRYLINYNVIKNWSLGTAQQMYRPMATVHLYPLIPQFGVQAEQVEPEGYVATPEAAAYYARIKLAQANANAWTVTATALLRLGIGPNRPCWFEARECLATVRGVVNAINWGPSGSVSQKLELNCRRGWSGMTNDVVGKIYEPYGGIMAESMNYAQFFQDGLNKAAESTKSDAHPAAAKGSSKTKSKARTASDATIKRREATFRTIASEIEQDLQATTNVRVGSLVTSLSRTSEHNDELLSKGASPTSAHIDGLAMDLSTTRLPQGVTGDQLKAAVDRAKARGTLPPDAKVIYKRPVHNRDGSTSVDHVDHVHIEVSDAWLDGDRKTGGAQ